jgi:WD40 repeat protein
MSPGSTCPDPPVLAQLALGQLSGPVAEELERHLATCARCAATLRGLPAEDDLVRALRPPLRPEERPRLHLAESVLPALKRLRPKGSTVTWNVTAGDEPAPDGMPAERLGFLSPRQGPGEIGRLGPFRVLGLLGSGGMGVVLRAEDTALKRAIALKVVRPGLVASPEARARFLHEAQALAALEHDHIVTVYQVGEDNGQPFLAMPLLRGETLQQRLDRTGGPLPVDTVLRLGREIATGLAVAHARGLIHRDVKPGNVWIEAGEAAGRERVKILDFGLVQALSGGEGPAHRPGHVLGTPAYMAPEQARGLAVDARADLFSLGCVLYRMATGRPPFDAADLCGLLVRLAVDEPPPPRRLNADVPAALDRLVGRLLSKNPEDRPASARVVVEALQALEDARRRRLLRRLLLGAAAGVLLAGAVAVWGLRSSRPGPSALEPGEVTFAYEEPDSRIAMQRGDQAERVVDVNRASALALPPGEYALRAVAAAEQRRLWPERLLVKPGAKQTVGLQLIGLVAGHRPHDGPVRALTVLSQKDGLLALSVSEDRSLVAWEIAGTAGLHTHWHRDSPLRCLALAPDGRTVATGSGGVGPNAVHAIRFWDPDDLEPGPGDLTCRSQVNVLAYSPDGRWLLSGENDGTLLLWDLRARVVEAEQPRAHGGLGVFAAAFLPDGKHVLTAGGDGAVVERTTADLEATRTLAGHAGPVRAVAVLPGGEQAVSAGQDATIRAWNLAGGTARIWSAPAPVEALAVSPDGTRLLTGDAVGAVRLWDLAAGQEIVHFDGHERAVTAVAFTPDRRRALSGGVDGAVRLWQLPR